MADIEPEDWDRMQEPVLADALLHCEIARNEELNNGHHGEVDRKERMVAKAVEALNELLQSAGSKVTFTIEPMDIT